MNTYSLSVLLFLVFLGMFQNENIPPNENKEYPSYKQEWDIIQSYIDKGLIRDALEATEDLYSRANAADNFPQIYKCLITIQSLSAQLTENSLNSVLSNLENSLTKAKPIVAAILYSSLGEMYYAYFEQNSYRLSQQAKQVLEDSVDQDIQTWPAERILKRANDYIVKSIENESILREPIQNYIEIVDYEKDEEFRPSLYDLLLFRAIAHFSKSQSHSVDFSSVASQSELFSDSEDFIRKQPFENTVLRLYQKALIHFENTKNLKGFIDANLLRLKYGLSQCSSGACKTDYEEALIKFHKEQKKHVASAAIQLALAEYLFEKSHQTAEPKDEVDLNRVDSLCDLILKSKQDSVIDNRARMIKELLREKFIQIQVEQVNLPAKPFRVFVQHKNVSQLEFKIYKIDPLSILKSRHNNSEEIEDLLKKSTIIRTWKEDWPISKDFRTHGVELKIDALPAGQYALVSSKENINDVKKPGVYFEFFQVAALAHFNVQKENGNSSVYIVDRESGAPIKNVSVHFYKVDYNNQQKGNAFKELSVLKSNNEGMVSAPSGTNSRFYVTYKKEFLISEDWISTWHGAGQEPYEYSLFFTDRSIYRPGQKVQFKVLSLRHDKNALPSIVKNKKLKITLRNTNQQIVGESAVISNEFGSASGFFNLPASGLNGDYTIETIGGAGYFKVEEYKRPNFEIVFDTLNDNYKLDDSIKIKGNIKSFNGIGLAGAKINYIVHRNEIYPFRFCWVGIMPRITPPEQISLGQTLSAKDGSFEITFYAKSKKEFSNSALQEFTIDADATDINGETQSNRQNIQLSEKAVFIQTDLIPIFSRDYKSKFKVSFSNSQLVPIRAGAEIKLIELLNENTFLRKSYWEKPDVFKYTKAEYKSLFPYDVYMDEDQIQTWKENGVVKTWNLPIQYSHELNLDFLKKEGKAYKIIISAKTEKGETNKIEDYFVITSDKNPSWIRPEVLVHQQKLEPGQMATFTSIGLNRPYHQFAIYQSRSNVISHWNKITSDLTYETLLSEADRGTVYYQTVCIVQNNLFIQEKVIEVPWTNKTLNIKTLSFRDKMKPGDKENWSFEITDTKMTKAEKEVMVSMYDVSLDKIYPHQWNLSLWPGFNRTIGIHSSLFNSKYLRTLHYEDNSRAGFYMERMYSRLKVFGLDQFVNFYHPPPFFESKQMARDAVGNGAVNQTASEERQSSAKVAKEEDKNYQVPIRKNLHETVFFYPHLKTDADGILSFSFTMNEAMTRWKFQMLAHTNDLKYGLQSFEVVTQKPIQIKPFYPRFFRQGDAININATISNLTEASQKVDVKLEIVDPISNQIISSEFMPTESTKSVQVSAQASEGVSFKIRIPNQETRALLIRFIALGSNHTDGEEMIIPVVSNTKLVTETMPLAIKSKESREYKFSALDRMFASKTAIPHQFTLELTSHPVWYAIQSLPYLIEYPHDCSEQLMSRIFANTLGTSVLKKYPKVAEQLSKMNAEGTNISNLYKNEELKSALLEETPWLLEAQNESEQMKRIALLLDLSKINVANATAIQKLSGFQNKNGSFSWFSGGNDDWYITQHIIVEIAHLKRMNALSTNEKQLLEIVNRAKPYLESKLLESYEMAKKSISQNKNDKSISYLDNLPLLYLYAKSYFPDWINNAKGKEAESFYLDQIQKFWKNDQIYLEGICALIAQKNGNPNLAMLIVKSLKQRAIIHPELGMYWKNKWSYHWSTLPVESQALMIELFHEVGNDLTSVDLMKTWLLKNKQTQHWGTTKSTTAAIYAILNFGTNFTENTSLCRVELANSVLDVSAQSVTGYFKKSFNRESIKPAYANVKLTNPNNSIAWGAVYIQYFEDLDKIEKSQNTPLVLEKQLFIKETVKGGTNLKPISANSLLRIGDLVTARVIIKVDRPMDYVHLKIMRAAGLEPTQQLSGHQWTGRLFYYLSPRDLATDIFIHYLPIGTHVIEYDVRASFIGNFSDGISTLQCMYAPEFSSHSKGIRLQIAE
ncbi:MAG: MG2 domain-containing protein [Bacteroidota bacterium]|nr:MG2 domain-containing protein [Bacteroidota bacterium]